MNRSTETKLVTVGRGQEVARVKKTVKNVQQNKTNVISVTNSFKEKK